jgi:hypothetical protein
MLMSPKCQIAGPDLALTKSAALSVYRFAFEDRVNNSEPPRRVRRLSFAARVATVCSVEMERRVAAGAVLDFPFHAPFVNRI